MQCQAKIEVKSVPHGMNYHSWWFPGVYLHWQEAQHDVCKLQTYLTSCLKLFIGGQLPSLIFADSLGLFICQLVSSFTWFPVVNPSSLFCQRETKKCYHQSITVYAFVGTLSVATNDLYPSSSLTNFQDLTPSMLRPNESVLKQKANCVTFSNFECSPKIRSLAASMASSMGSPLLVLFWR